MPHIKAELPDGRELSSEEASRILQTVSTHRSALRRVEQTVATLPVGVGPANTAQLTLLDQKWRQVEETYGTLDAAGYARLVGASPTTRSAATKARGKGLLGYRRGHRILYPRFQFDDHGLKPGWNQVVFPLREAGWSDEDIILWLVSPNGALGRAAPINLLDDDHDRVLAVIADKAAGIW